MGSALCSTATPKPTSPVQSRAWEDLRKEARKLESELDSRVAAYGKLCSGFDSSYASKGESGLAAEQVCIDESLACTLRLLVRPSWR